MAITLCRDEDLDLRRLAVLERFGLLQGATSDRFDQLRHRDRRNDVREPVDIVVPMSKSNTPGIVREWGE
jgi:hypothetical protein